MRAKLFLAVSCLAFVGGALVACSDGETTSSLTPSSSTARVTIVDNLSGSIYSEVTYDEDYDFGNMMVGDTIGFTITPDEDYSITSVTNSGTIINADEGRENHYTITLNEGSNRLTAAYEIDADVDFVEKFKLNVSASTYADIMTRWSRIDLDFRKDGIEQAVSESAGGFVNYVDGDTTHLETLHYGYTVKVRYLSIDTPESTSELEEWGKSASLYNQSKLSTATYIILQSQGRAMYPDSTDKSVWESTTDSNGRNLAYVWYTDVEGTPTVDDFRCLNLEMVYQGYSYGVGSINDCGLEYYKMLEKAYRSAQANKRGMFSGEADPNYWYGNPVDVTLKEIYEGTTRGGTLKDGKTNPYCDEKTLYRVEGYVSRKVGGAFYFQDKYDYEQVGTEPVEAYGLYVFTYAQTAIQVGHHVSVIGVISEYSGTLQLMGISWHTIGPDPNRDTTILDNGTRYNIVPIKVTADYFGTSTYNYNHVLIEFVDDVYSYAENARLGTLQPDGGTHAINHYNEKYPFYNTSNKCIFFGGLGSTSGTGIRMTLDQDILLNYNSEVSVSYKFFSGGTNYYYPGYPEYVAYQHGLDFIYNNKNVFADFEDLWHEHKNDPELQTEVYTRKIFHLTGISQYYVSSSGSNERYSVNIVASGDVNITGTIA